MAACAQAVQQPDGRLVLELMPAATDLSTCQYVVQSGAELANSLFSLTAVEGAKLSSGIIACWLVAYFGRTTINVIRQGSSNL